MSRKYRRFSIYLYACCVAILFGRPALRDMPERRPGKRKLFERLIFSHSFRIRSTGAAGGKMNEDTSWTNRG
jgi:hypothetical protein